MSVTEKNSYYPNVSVRASHPLRSLNYQQGDRVDLVHFGHPSEIKEYPGSTFVCCFIRDSVDVVRFVHDSVEFIVPLHQVGVVGVEIERVK
jgi:hypothetical protein